MYLFSETMSIDVGSLNRSRLKPVGDMQTDVHDSVEDALAAFELYQKAIDFKKNGKWETMLDDIYAFGQKNDWKLGVDGEEKSAG